MDHKITGYLPLTPSNLAICDTLLKLFGGIFQLVKLSFLWWKIKLPNHILIYTSNDVI
jgi:hypothetical protein